MKKTIELYLMINKIKRLFTIPDHFCGQRLDTTLTTLLNEYSRAQVQHWLNRGEIKVDNKVKPCKYRLKGSENIVIDIAIEQKVFLQPEPLPLTIVFEDEALLITNKATNTVVHPGAGNTNHTLVNALLHHHSQLTKLPRAGLIHRLDKDTTGLLIVAKTLASYNHLGKQLRKRTISRGYNAIVWGNMIAGNTISAPIGRHPKWRTKMAVRDNGKQAITHYQIIKRFKHHCHIKVKLETGRTHQIRVHMNYIHHPIVGDPSYGGQRGIPKDCCEPLKQALKKFNRQALHASSLSLLHPITKEKLDFTIPLPDDMQTLLDKLNHSLVLENKKTS